MICIILIYFIYRLYYLLYVYIFYLNWCDACTTFLVNVEASITWNMINTVCLILLMNKILHAEPFHLVRSSLSFHRPFNESSRLCSNGARSPEAGVGFLFYSQKKKRKCCSIGRALIFKGRSTWIIIVV